MKNILLLLLAFACAGICHGQEVEKARIRMFKETVEFLARDSVTFKEVAVKKCNQCESMDSIKSFIARNKLTRVDEVIDKLDKTNTDTSEGGWKNAMSLLKRDIINNFFEQPAKEFRKDIPGYDNYEESMEKIIESIKAPVKPKPTPPTPVKKTESVQEASFSIPPLLWYGIIAGLAALCCLLFVQKNTHKNNYESERNQRRALEDELAGRKHTEQMHRSTIASLEEELKMALEDKKTAELSLQKIETSLSPKEIPTVTETPPTPDIIKKYAKYADAGNGFSESYFVDKPNNETIFEITLVSPGMATYVVSNDLDVQKYALSNADYFLRRACQYDSLPTINSVINTKEPGHLRKEGNKWVIEVPAKVSF